VDANMVATILDPVLHAVVALALLAAYVVLWCYGHQDQTLLGILGGQLGGLGISHVAQSAAVAKATAPSVAVLAPTDTAVTPPPVA